MSLSVNVNEKANLIWSIADKLTGAYKPHEYGEVILPMTVLRRFDCVLEENKDKVLDGYSKIEDMLKGTSDKVKNDYLIGLSGYNFYNTSKYNFKKLLDDPSNIKENFRKYISGFSDNVQDIIKNFEFDKQIDKLVDKKLLYYVMLEFTTNKGDLHINKISNIEMGYIFEEIIRRFSEAHNEDAGQHYTPREVIELMVNILFNDVDISNDGSVKTIYDPTCGTGGIGMST